MKAELFIQLIKASLVIAPTKDIRYYLNGVHFSYDNIRHNLKVQSTDGHIITRAFTRFDNTFIDKDNDGFILSVQDCKTAVQALKAYVKYDIKLVFNTDSNTLHIGINDNDRWLTFNGVDGRYPDTDRVIHPEHKAENTTELGLNYELLGKIGKYLKQFKVKQAQAKMVMFGASGGIQFNRTIETCDEEVFVDGRVMPCRL